MVFSSLCGMVWVKCEPILQLLGGKSKMEFRNVQWLVPFFFVKHILLIYFKFRFKNDDYGNSLTLFNVFNLQNLNLFMF